MPLEKEVGEKVKANPEMIEGYRDGLDLDSPDPSANRTASYRHGFYNGRDDRRGKPRDSYHNLIEQAQKAIAEDSSAREALTALEEEK